MQLRRFLTRECLLGQEWWNYPNNHYLWHIKEKKRTKYWPTLAVKSTEESGKVEAYKTRGS